MKKIIVLLLVAMVVVMVVVMVFITPSSDYCIVSMSTIDEACEYSYFEGQRDALEGDIRIKLNHDSCWIWTKSPWDSGKPPIYNPLFAPSFTRE